MAKYSVHQQPVETLLSWIKSGEIAIPEIPRSFVLEDTKEKCLVDSRYLDDSVRNENFKHNTKQTI